MKKYLLLFTILVLGLSACKKGDIVTEQASVDDAKIQAYIAATGYNMTKDPSGVYYQIITPGTGTYPTPTSTVKVTYTGTYLNGQSFGSGASQILTLGDGGTVPGFAIALQHVNTGGRIRFILPSGLAYGPAGNSPIPANAILVYVLDLNGFY
jgi:FKBP-type peptidyl-prolyl cis-trans isomerase FkpA